MLSHGKLSHFFAAFIATIVTCSGRSMCAITLHAGNLIATVDEFTGQDTAPKYVAEYTPAGNFVQRLAFIPSPDGSSGPSTQHPWDTVLGPDNAVYVFNGSLTTTLARYGLTSMTWTQQTYAGWSTRNNSSGGLARLGQYIYASDQDGLVDCGVVRFDTNGGPTLRFATTENPIDINLSPQNELYTLSAASFSNNVAQVRKFDPLTFALLGTVSLPAFQSEPRAIAVAADGSIFIATFGGAIQRFSPQGALLDSAAPGGQFQDIDIDASGRIALGTFASGEVVLTDLSLDTFTRRRITDSVLGGDVQVSWLPVPEPATPLIATLCLLIRITARGTDREAVARAPNIGE